MTAKKNTTKLAVSFGGVSIGDHTARLGLTVDRDDTDLDQIDGLFSSSRLRASLDLARPDEKEQEAIKDWTEIKLASVVDAKGYSANDRHFSAGLTFVLSEIDVSTLARFAKGRGTIVLERIGAAGAEG